MEKRRAKESRKSVCKSMTITSVFKVKKCLFNSSYEFKSPQSKLEFQCSERSSFRVAKQSVSPDIQNALNESPYSLFTVRKRRADTSDEKADLNRKSLNVMDCSTPLKRCSALIREIVDETALLKTSSPDNHVKIAVQKSIQNPDLIGDFSKPCILPTVTGKHPDLQTISPSTVADLLRGTESPTFKIFDCRYPYEFTGGHIRNAQNIYYKGDAEQEFFSSLTKENADTSILIFYCEFSSERAPNMMRFLRSTDRDLNKDRYPFLHYPELYVIEGGYKAFYNSFKDLCDPQHYKQMLDEECTQQMSFYRSQCKNWSSRQKRIRKEKNSMKR